MLKISEIHELIKQIDDSSIDEFSFESNGTKLSLKKHSGETVAVQSAPSPQPVVQVPQENNAPKEEAVQETKAPEQTPEVKTYDHEIVSPMVGTFYSAPSPDKDDFVHTGDQVKPDTVVCIVEAMKLFNEIEADVKGEIVEILVENGELVEYGQPLFRVKNV